MRLWQGILPRRSLVMLSKTNFCTHLNELRPEAIMEFLTSRKNKIITHLKNLSTDGAYRRETGEFVCDGEKLLKEALEAGFVVKYVLWGGEASFKLHDNILQYSCPNELMQSVSPLKNSRGPVFSVEIRHNNFDAERKKPVTNAIVLENVQDPGNVGTVIRTANAMGVDAVILVGDCADIYSPKTVRASMGGIFRETVLEMSIEELERYVNQNELRLYGAALSDKAEDIRKVDMKSLAVAVGSEGRGLTDELLNICDGRLIIPMQPNCESLNAAVAASIIMWEFYR